MTEDVKPDYDVIVIGGGPAGSTTASYLAQAGKRVLVLEKEAFPRAHVGESLVPATTRVFRELGFLDTMEEAGFVHKYGAAWSSDAKKSIYSHDFEGTGVADYEVEVKFAEREQEGVGQNYTYHVDRAKFDDLLLKHARKLGADVWEQAPVSDVDFEARPFVKVRCKKDGEDHELTARMIVDASGRRTLVGTKLDLRIKDPQFDQYAIHTWFDGYDRTDPAHPEKDDFIFIHFLPLMNTWVWQIPITDTITSIGVVTTREHFSAAKASLEEFFWKCLDTRPELAEPLRAARQARDFTTESDYSYAMTKITGDRFAMVGDAARFVDPIFSSGVSVAMSSARFLCWDILEAFEQGDDFSEERFTRYQKTLRAGCENWYKFISLYYRLNVLFTYFVTDKRYRLDILRLLQGDVYDEEEPEVLTKMREMVETVEANPNHVWHGLLNSLTDDSFKPAF